MTEKSKIGVRPQDPNWFPTISKEKKLWEAGAVRGAELMALEMAGSRKGGAGQVIGGLGEVVVELCLSNALGLVVERQPSEDVKRYDLVVNGRSVEIKTKSRNRPLSMHFDVSVPMNRRDYQIADFYIHAQAVRDENHGCDALDLNQYREVQIAGWCSRKELIERGKRVSKGTPMPNGRQQGRYYESDEWILLVENLNCFTTFRKAIEAANGAER